MSKTGPFDHWRQAVETRDVPQAKPAEGSGPLPARFQFSQHSLQDYDDCARRFQLGYVLRTRWPAVPSEPAAEYERLSEQGRQFHLLVQRHISGIPEEKLRPPAGPLADWWDAYLHVPPPGLPSEMRRAEVQLSTPLGAHRLVAKFDLLALARGERAVIVDWKTALRRPRREVLARRLQTRVYPFVLVEAGRHLFGGVIEPEQVELIYWFTSAPADPEIFRYNAAIHEDNRSYLHRLAAEILAREDEVWPLTPDFAHCRYCVYRSLCDRGVQAGSLYDDEADRLDVEPDEVDFTLDDIAPIEF
ncbi:MAG TPA: PD-(D/E)XK nuclease family protein [Aggregatilineales bacterium]|nr:PD-(D/E)XK nuclease family protein [Aggregatilineales bacterium]